jgi:hypothetical protein
LNARPLILPLTLTIAAALLTRSGADPAALHAFWPQFPLPKKIVRLEHFATRGEEFTAQTLAGLVARKARLKGAGELLWLPTDHPAYQRSYRRMLEVTGAREEGPRKLWDLVARYQAQGLVKGYLLYRADRSTRGLHLSGPLDASVNVATSLCAPFQAIAVSEEEEPRARALGLARLLDARTLTETECFDRYRARFERRVLALQDPRLPNIRAEAVALGSLMLTQPGPLYERALQWADPGSPILGWGVGDERDQTSPVSRWGQFITSTDWCQNLTVLADHPGLKLPKARLRRPAPRSLWELPWERDVHYAAFVMSDGDNVQWLMGDFQDGRERSWWASPDRGSVPVGWTTCTADLAQLCPYSLERLFATATPKDDFLLFSGGYYYPDEFGRNRKGQPLLRQHAARLNAYMKQDGQNLLTVNMQRWDSPAAQAAYETYAQSMPGLLGIYAIQYAPYAAGKGRVLWAKDHQGDDVPILSPRFAIWNHSEFEQDGSPSQIAERLNRQAYRGEPSTEDHFSWVVVHAWSWFRHRAPGEPASAEEIDQSRGGETGTARGLTPVRWCREALDPHVRVVTPTELTLLLRLRSRPGPTLKQALRELDERARRQPGTKAGLSLREARTLLAREEYQAAFAAGKRAFLALRAPVE